MADVRALLKAKRQEARITHPYASYSSSGQLRCSICGLSIKHAAAWEGHLGSKTHRTNVAKAKAEEAERERKRKAEEMEIEEQDGEDVDDEMNGGENEDTADAERRKRRKTEEPEQASQEAGSSTKGGGFPADFFSDPSRAPPVADESDEDEEDGANGTTQTRATEANGAGTSTAKGVVDEEWEAFQRAVIEPAAKAQPSEEDSRERYAQATVFSEAKMYDAPTGIPSHDAETSAQVEEVAEETEEEKRRRKEQEEREIIMDRLLEEERAQEEADAKVNLLKGRLEMLKKKRELAKAKKGERT